MIAEVPIRLAQPADAPVIASMSRDYIEQGLGWGWTPEHVTKALADRDVNVAVVGPPGAVVAFGIMRYAARHAHLELLGVRRSHQRRGVGSALLCWLERVAVLAGAERILVEARRSNEAARCFYNEHGYHERHVEQGMYHGIEDGIAFEKWLKRSHE